MVPSSRFKVPGSIITCGRGALTPLFLCVLCDPSWPKHRPGRAATKEHKDRKEILPVLLAWKVQPIHASFRREFSPWAALPRPAAAP
jgi:hypothetical protein